MGGPYPLAGSLNRTKRPASPQAGENPGVRGFGLELKCYLFLISARLLAHPVDFELADENFHIYVLFSHSVVSDFATPWTSARQTSLFFTISKSCSLSWWCHPTISFSATHFTPCSQCFPASRTLPMSWLFASGGQNIGASASVSVLPMNSQGWFPLGLIGLISL